MNIATLFTGKEIELAKKRLANKLTGDKLRLGKFVYVKTGEDEVDLYEPPATPKASNDDDGSIEIGWAQQLAATFSSRYRMVRMEYQPKFILHDLEAGTRELRIANLDHAQANMREFIGADLPLRKADAAIKRAFDRMQCDTTMVIRESQVAPLLFADQEPARPCYRRLPFNSTPLNEMPTPLGDLCKLAQSTSGANALVLWLGSILDPDSSRIQYIALYGGGKNGKSTLLDALHSVLGAASIKTSASDFMSRFGFADAAHKRLMMFDDNNNTSFMTSGEFKRVTGSNTIGIERKGKDKYETRNDLKIIIATNRLLQVTGDEADIRRNIIIPMNRYDGTGNGTAWVESFNNAMPDILRYCYTKYLEHKGATGGTAIPVPEGGEEALYGFSAKVDAEDFINAFFFDETDKEAMVRVKECEPVRPLDVRKLLTRERVDAKVAVVVREILHTKYIPSRKSPFEPRYHKGLWFRKIQVYT